MNLAALLGFFVGTAVLVTLLTLIVGVFIKRPLLPEAIGTGVAVALGIMANGRLDSIRVLLTLMAGILLALWRETRHPPAEPEPSPARSTRTELEPEATRVLSRRTEPEPSPARSTRTELESEATRVLSRRTEPEPSPVRSTGGLVVWPISVLLCIFAGVALAEGVNLAGSRGTGAIFGGVVLLICGFLLRFAVWKEGNPERVTPEKMGPLAWGCLCWMFAGLTPQILRSPWISRPGKLTTGEYAAEYLAGAAAFLVAHMLGWAILNPKTAIKVVGWGVLAVVGLGIALVGIGAIFEALTVKLLLAIIVVLLLFRGQRF